MFSYISTTDSLNCQSSFLETKNEHTLKEWARKKKTRKKKTFPSTQLLGSVQSQHLWYSCCLHIDFNSPRAVSTGNLVFTWDLLEYRGRKEANHFSLFGFSFKFFTRSSRYTTVNLFSSSLFYTSRFFAWFSKCVTHLIPIFVYRFICIILYYIGTHTHTCKKKVFHFILLKFVCLILSLNSYWGCAFWI